MAAFLSPNWIEAADAAVVAADISAPDPVVIQNTVIDDAGTVFSYHVAVDSDGARVLPGEHDDPTVTYRFGSETAAGIAAGECDPYAEFMAGRMEIAGDAAALVNRKNLMESLQLALSGVRGA